MLNRLEILVLSALLATGLAIHAGSVSADPGAQLSSPPGVPVQAGSSGDTRPRQQPDHAQLQRTVTRYQQHLRELERNEGALSDRVAEESTALGLVYRELGEYKNALEAFKRSLHISRANHGPDNPRQLPLLELIIQTNSDLSDWKAVDENYQLLYWTARRAFQGNIPQLLELIYRIARWHLQAYLTEYDPIPYQHLLESEKLFHDAVDIIEKTYGPDDAHLIEALNGIAITNYHVTSHIDNANTTDEMDEIRASSAKMSRAKNVSSDLVWNPLRYSRTESRRVLNRIVHIYAKHPELAVADRATALVNLGDWYLIYGWRSHALKNYRMAYSLLEDNGPDTGLIEKLFGKPVLIPAMTNDYPDMRDRNGSTGKIPYVRMTFEVTDLGCARRIKFIEESNTDKYAARINAKRVVRSSMFRPKFNGVKPVLERHMVLRLSGDALSYDGDRKLVNYEMFPGFIATQRCNHIR